MDIFRAEKISFAKLSAYKARAVEGSLLPGHPPHSSSYIIQQLHLLMKIGLLSDTHSFLDDNIFDHFADCDQLWHAGDIGDPVIMDRLAAFKPLKGVYGNIDGKEVRVSWPKDARFACEELQVWITHIGGYPPKYNPEVLKELRTKPPHIFVCGHTHILRVMTDAKLNNLLYLNPGAAGHHGFHVMRTLLKFEINGKKISNMQAVELGRRGRN